MGFRLPGWPGERDSTSGKKRGCGVRIVQFLPGAGYKTIAIRIFEEDVLASVAQEKGQLVFAGADPGVLKALESSGVAYFDLSQTGAITVFEDHGRFLLLPFLK